MIKCAYLNMSQLYIHMWTSGRVADVLHQLMGILIKKTKKCQRVVQHTRLIWSPRLFFNFDKPCRHLAGFQLDKGQKFRSEMSQICSTDPGSPLRELLGTVNCVDWTQNQI